MINQDRWVKSLSKTNVKNNKEGNRIDPSRWINTISKRNTYSSVEKYFFNSVGKYSLLAVLFICGLLFVSVVKNETRNLEKEINHLRASNNAIKFNLDQTILDNEVITSPENISRLAKEYLDNDFIFYKKSQIRQLNDDTKITNKLNRKKNNLSKKVKLEITNKIEKMKKGKKKLQELYSNPRLIPGKIKTQVVKKINKKKTELKELYVSPEKTFTLEKTQKWAAVQVVKLFLGMPIVPGK